MFGFLIEDEIKSVDKVLNSTEKPLTAIVGGAKVSSKITIIEHLLDKVDNLIVGGRPYRWRFPFRHSKKIMLTFIFFLLHSAVTYERFIFQLNIFRYIMNLMCVNRTH